MNFVRNIIYIMNFVRDIIYIIFTNYKTWYHIIYFINYHISINSNFSQIITSKYHKNVKIHNS